MNFYLILKENGEWFTSPLPSMDKPGEKGEVLRPALPLVIIEQVLTQAFAQGSGNTSFPNAEKKQRVLKKLERDRTLSNLAWSWSSVEESADIFECPPDFEPRVRGHQLTDGDLGWLAQEMNVPEEKVWHWADHLVRSGEGEWIPAVRRYEGRWQCQRCGGEDVEEWPSVFGMAATCKNCLSVGSATSLGTLFRSQMSKEKQFMKARNCFQPQVILTPAQERAAAELLEFMTKTNGSKTLIWAACGAGKTEVGFPAIDWALRKGIPVLFAAPRQDVVLDVVPRLQRDFAGLEVSVLSGRTPGISRGRLTRGLVVATTHQVLRFYQAFGLIILDEMDAFPYAGSQALDWAIRHAIRPEGKLILMTATPSQQERMMVEKEGGKVIRLPARHHRHPLPVPTWERLGFLESGEVTLNRDESRFQDHLKTLRERGPVLLFVPKIAWVDFWVKRLRKAMPEARVAGSFSSDPGRQAKIAQLREGKTDFFVSTSILERGVTIESVQVAVLAADHPVFDDRSLIQMAGRAGRSPRDPYGEVCFWSERKTPSIESAIHWIREQNALAYSQGLIEVDAGHCLGGRRWNG